MSLLGTVLGRPLASTEEHSQRVNAVEGTAAFGLDALGSAAYGPEAALTVLLPLGLLGLRYLLPLTITIVVLLLIVFFSYRQTIAAYPNGGGAYTVASQNLGARAGLFAGASLMLDYILNVCVGISTGVGALISAVPRLQPHTLGLCLLLLFLLTAVNLRGIHDTGLLWTIPTCAFLLSLFTVLVIGIYKASAAHGHPHPLAPLPHQQQTLQAASTWLLLRAFAGGCSALTGVEAVSNGVPVFCEPEVRTARRTLTIIVVALTMLLLGSAWLVRAYGITATPPGGPSYQLVLSMMTSAVVGRGWFYGVAMVSVLLVLSLSANTSFADFPRLCRAMADDGYLPASFALRGRRLAFFVGILVLGAFSSIILVAFGGITDRLIPLFAIGAFCAFTMSQAAMVGHWRRVGGEHAKLGIAINGLGAAATGLTAVLVFLAKFREGAWITAAVLGLILLTLSAVHRHLRRATASADVAEILLDPLPRLPTMLLPVSRWNKASMAALQLACTLSDDVRVLHLIEFEDEREQLTRDWQSDLNFAARAAGVAPPKVIVIRCPYRSITDPILKYLVYLEREKSDRKIAIVFAEVVPRHWYQHFAHNYRSLLLKSRLFFQANRRIVIVDMPWQLPS